MACMESELNHAYMASKHTVLMEHAINYINEHYTSDQIRISDLADESGVSKVYFRKKFKEYTGLSPLQYVKKRRIEWAKELLVSS